jgi:hypothetical protein
MAHKKNGNRNAQVTFFLSIFLVIMTTRIIMCETFPFEEGQVIVVASLPTGKESNVALQTNEDIY